MKNISKYAIWILEKVPLISPFVAFPFYRHFQALSKFMALWIMCTLPVILAVILTPKPKDTEAGLSGFFDVLSISFSASEQFVYASAFIPPLIYLIIERYFEAEKSDDGKRLSIRKIFNGYWPVFFIAMIMLLISMITYALTKAGFESQHTYYYQFYNFSFEHAWFMYGISLYCWYLSILDGTSEKTDFFKDTEQAEKDFSGQFSDRINQGRLNNEQ